MRRADMRIGVVSDTHIHSPSKPLPQALINGLQGVDMILHAGDWMVLEVVQMLEEIAPVDGVAGNNDGSEIVEKFGRSKILKFGNHRVGIVHGDGMHKTTEIRAWETFSGDNVDVIIFGHSHIPLQVHHQGVLLFNPGSPTDKRRQPEYSYGILELKDSIVAKHYYYADKS